MDGSLSVSSHQHYKRVPEIVGQVFINALAVRSRTPTISGACIILEFRIIAALVFAVLLFPVSMLDCRRRHSVAYTVAHRETRTVDNLGRFTFSLHAQDCLRVPGLAIVEHLDQLVQDIARFHHSLSSE